MTYSPNKVNSLIYVLIRFKVTNGRICSENNGLIDVQFSVSASAHHGSARHGSSTSARLSLAFHYCFRCDNFALGHFDKCLLAGKHLLGPFLHVSFKQAQQLKCTYTLERQSKYAIKNVPINP